MLNFSLKIKNPWTNGGEVYPLQWLHILMQHTEYVMRFSNAAGQPAKLGTELGKQEAPDMGDSSL